MKHIAWFDQSLLARIKRLTFVAHRRQLAGAGGPHPGRRLGPSGEFADYRAYQPGDDPRRIDWNIYARLDKLLVKVTETQEALPLQLLVDCSRSMDWGTPNKLVYAKQLAAALACVALEQSAVLSAACFSNTLTHRFPPARGRGQLLPFIRFLDRVGADGETDLPRSCRLCGQQGFGRRGLVVLISDLWAPTGLAESLACLRGAQTDVLVLHLLAAGEVNPELGGSFQLRDAESGRTAALLLTPATLDRYRARLATWCADLEATCRQRQARYLRVLTNQPLETVLLSGLRQKGILR